VGQDEYAQKLEENEETLKTKMSARACEDVAAASQETEERVRLEMEEKIILAETRYDTVMHQSATLRSKVAELQADAAMAQESECGHIFFDFFNVVSMYVVRLHEACMCIQHTHVHTNICMCRMHACLHTHKHANKFTRIHT
jgi:hypothetical protein